MGLKCAISCRVVVERPRRRVFHWHSKSQTKAVMGSNRLTARRCYAASTQVMVMITLHTDMSTFWTVMIMIFTKPLLVA